MSHASSDTIATAQSEPDALVKECQQLLVQVSRRPGDLKLLVGVRNQLKIFALVQAG